MRGVFVKLSHSRVETFANCPRKFEFRYVNKINAPRNLEPGCALTIGTFLHMAIEKDIKTATKYYYDQFPIITNKHIEEVMKIEYWIPKILEMIPRFGVHEIRIENNDFVGCIDFLAPVKKVDNIEYFDMYDWKYSNGIERYKKSGQLHEYKYFFEKMNPNEKIRDMYFLFVPKTQIRMKKKKRREEKHKKREERIKMQNKNEVRREKIRLNNKKYRETHRDEIRARKKAYHEAHREEILAKKKAYRESHREEIRLKDKEYRETHRKEISERRKLARLRKRKQKEYRKRYLASLSDEQRNRLKQRISTWEKNHRKERNQYHREYRKKKPEYSIRYRMEHREKMREYMKVYSKTPEFREKQRIRYYKLKELNNE